MSDPLEPPHTPDRRDLDELFEQLYRDLYPGLVSLFGRRGLDPETSRDLAQDTLLRAYTGLARFEDRSSLHTWVLKIATNQWRNWVRDHRQTAKRGVRPGSLEAAREDGLQVADDRSVWRREASDPERRSIERQARRRIRARLSELAPRQRECMELWLEGRPYRRIAEELGVSIQTVRASLFQAKKRLAGTLRAEFPRPVEGAPSAGGES